MRFLGKRILLYALTALGVIFLIIQYRSKKNLEEEFALDSNCQVPAATRLKLISLMKNTHRILDQLHLTHFLCFGTLWGVLKMESLLPWEYNVNFCALNEELSKYEEAHLIRLFRKNNLVLKYDSQDGFYEVYPLNEDAAKQRLGLIKIIVFERDATTDMMKRVGWTRRVLPPDCDISPSLQCFPPRLIEKPLPTVVIEGTSYSVPREDIEIQKYLYPDSWWKDVKPKQC